MVSNLMLEVQTSYLSYALSCWMVRQRNREGWSQPEVIWTRLCWVGWSSRCVAIVIHLEIGTRLSLEPLCCVSYFLSRFCRSFKLLGCIINFNSGSSLSCQNSPKSMSWFAKFFRLHIFKVGRILQSHTSCHHGDRLVEKTYCHFRKKFCSQRVVEKLMITEMSCKDES